MNKGRYFHGQTNIGVEYMNDFIKKSVTRCHNNTSNVIRQNIIEEEPLLIRVGGQPYSVVMRTPGKELFHIAGFCLSEGLIDHPDDIATTGFCTEDGSNVATVTLMPERRKQVADLLERKGFISQTSCGICGKELIEDLHQILEPLEIKSKISVSQATNCVNQLPAKQLLHKKTGSSHAAMIFNFKLEVMAVAEDVGRHNALDKAIGEVFLSGNIDNAQLAVLSSRISYELVQKAARAGLNYLIGMSKPTSLAVELAKSLNMAIASYKQNDFFIFSGQNYFIKKSS